MLSEPLSTLISDMWLERTKWMSASIGWPIAFTFWYQIMVVLYAANGEITQFALYYFQFLWIIIVCSFFSASFTPPSRCQVVDEKKSKSDVFCEPCNYRKPSRWHHCRRCNQCVHRMDHHCPILQLCIHSGNHKHFLLFILWPLQLAVFTVWHGYYDFWKIIRSVYTREELSITEQLKGTGVSNALMVGFAALYLLKNQLPNLLRNQTLIEESRETTIYDLGSWQENVKSVMGPWKIVWLPLPIKVEEKEDEKKNE